MSLSSSTTANLKMDNIDSDPNEPAPPPYSQQEYDSKVELARQVSIMDAQQSHSEPQRPRAQSRENVHLAPNNAGQRRRRPLPVPNAQPPSSNTSAQRTSLSPAPASQAHTSFQRPTSEPGRQPQQEKERPSWYTESGLGNEGSSSASSNPTSPTPSSSSHGSGSRAASHHQHFHAPGPPPPPAFSSSPPPPGTGHQTAPQSQVQLQSVPQGLTSPPRENHTSQLTQESPPQLPEINSSGPIDLSNLSITDTPEMNTGSSEQEHELPAFEPVGPSYDGPAYSVSPPSHATNAPVLATADPSSPRRAASPSPSSITITSNLNHNSPTQPRQSDNYFEPNHNQSNRLGLTKGGLPPGAAPPALSSHSQLQSQPHHTQSNNANINPPRPRSRISSTSPINANQNQFPRYSRYNSTPPPPPPPSNINYNNRPQTSSGSGGYMNRQPAYPPPAGGGGFGASSFYK